MSHYPEVHSNGFDGEQIADQRFIGGRALEDVVDDLFKKSDAESNLILGGFLARAKGEKPSRATSAALARAQEWKKQRLLASAPAEVVVSEQVSAEVPDTVPDMRKLPEAPVSPAVVSAAGARAVEAVATNAVLVTYFEPTVVA